ncbi:MAG: hypothetical protein IT381_00050 [Deltaproteobacteria bacterium]|nr:hypothetical protein [Deltaproteobacteria bacterium]
MSKFKTLYVAKEYASKDGKVKTSWVPAGQVFLTEDGKTDMRIDLPGYAGGQLVSFRENPAEAAGE